MAAFRAARDNGVVANEDFQFQGALGAIAKLYMDEGNDEMIDRIKEEIKNLKAVNAMMDGVPVDLAAMCSKIEENEPLGLMKLWYESAKKETPPCS